MGIWIDSESMGGIPDRGAPRIYSHPDCPKPPNNKKEIPCDSCPMKVACAAKWNPSEGLTCQAYRDWSGRGDYHPEQLQQKLKRVA
jgi:hypothetical protein